MGLGQKYKLASANINKRKNLFTKLFSHSGKGREEESLKNAFLNE
jgi:hypothetical protein